MYLKPKCLSNASLEAETLRADKKSCKRYGPCGVGQKALYLNNIVLDRCYYIPLDSVQRVYKRVAMSKGGYTGKGIFGSIPYLVVEYGRGESVQCTFKHEHHVDMMLAEIQQRFPRIKTMSEAAARMVRDSVRAYVNKDLELARQVMEASLEQL